MKFAYLLAVMMVVFYAGVMAQDHWICSCFRPDYDKGCCDGRGEMNGNVCDIPGREQASMLDYESCCTSINGTHKCK